MLCVGIKCGLMKLFLREDNHSSRFREPTFKQKLAILDVVSKLVFVQTHKGDLSSETQELLKPLTSIWCGIYFCSLKNLKLCQKVKKVKPAYSSFYIYYLIVLMIL